MRESFMAELRDVALRATRTIKLLQNSLMSLSDAKIENMFLDIYNDYVGKYKIREDERPLDEVDWKVFTYAAVGLFSYGHLDVIDDILDNMPPIPTEHGDGFLKRWPAAAVEVLLPLPDEMKNELYIRRHPEEIRNWVNLHRDRIQWAGDTIGYVLVSET